MGENKEVSFLSYETASGFSFFGLTREGGGILKLPPFLSYIFFLGTLSRGSVVLTSFTLLIFMVLIFSC
jgi:hypothetical protein